jgi:uncharacterized membrane protein
MEEISQTPQGEVKKEKNIGMAILAYILFFVPLLTETKKDPFVKFHVKQGLVLFIGWVVACIIAAIPFWGWLAARLLNLFLFVLMIIGILNAAKGKQEPLPLIGKFSEQFKF